MNPLVAFAAFYWLTRSVQLQKKELSDTRKELKNSAESQKKLVKNGEKSVRLAALTALANTLNAKIVNLDKLIDFNDVKFQGMGNSGDTTHHAKKAKLESSLKTMKEERDELVKKVDSFIEEIEKILKKPDEEASTLSTPD